MTWYAPTATRCIGTKFDAQFSITVNYNSGDRIEIWWNEASGGPAKVGEYNEALNIATTAWAYRKVACDLGDTAAGGNVTFTVKHYNSSETLVEECTSPTLSLAAWGGPTAGSSISMDFDVSLSSLVLNRDGEIRVYVMSDGVQHALIGTQNVSAGQTSATIRCLAEGETGANVVLGAYYYPSAGTTLFLRQATITIYGLHWVSPQHNTTFEGLYFTAQIAGIEGALENDSLSIVVAHGTGNARTVGTTTLTAGQTTANVSVTELLVTDASFTAVHGSKISTITLTITTEEDLPATPYPSGFKIGPVLPASTMGAIPNDDAFDGCYAGRATLGGTDYVIVPVTGKTPTFALYDIVNETWIALAGDGGGCRGGIFDAGDGTHIWTIDLVDHDQNYVEGLWDKMTITGSGAAKAKIAVRKFSIDPDSGSCTIVGTAHEFTMDDTVFEYMPAYNRFLFNPFCLLGQKAYAPIEAFGSAPGTSSFGSWCFFVICIDFSSGTPVLTPLDYNPFSPDATFGGETSHDFFENGHRLLSYQTSLYWMLNPVKLIASDATYTDLTDEFAFTLDMFGGIGVDTYTGLVHADERGNSFGQYVPGNGITYSMRSGIQNSFRWVPGSNAWKTDTEIMPQFPLFYWGQTYGNDYYISNGHLSCNYVYLSGNPLVAVGRSAIATASTYVWKFDPHPYASGFAAYGGQSGYVANWLFRDPDGFTQKQYRLKLMSGQTVVHDTQWVSSASETHTQSTIPAGTYTLKLWLRNTSETDGGLTNGPWTTTLVVGETTTNLPPVPSITNPTEGQIITGSLSVAVSATDDKGLSHAALYLDGILAKEWSLAGLGTTSWSSSHTLDTTLIGDSQHTLVLTMTDSHGATASATRGFTTNNTEGTGGTAPTITINSPAPGAIVTGTLSINVTAEDTDGIGNVTVLAGSSGFSYPYTNTPTSVTVTPSVDTTKLSNGPLTISVYSTDSTGLVSSKVITVTVANGGVTGNAPTITLTPPQTIDYNSPVPVSLSAADQEGIASIYLTISGVGAPIWSITNPPGTSYSGSVSVDFTGFANGTYTLTGTIVDTDGNHATDTIDFNVNVQAPVPHSIYSMDVEHYNEIVDPEDVAAPTDSAWQLWESTEMDKLSATGGSAASVKPKGTPYIPITMFDFDISEMLSWRSEQKDDAGTITSFDPRGKNSGVKRILFNCVCSCEDDSGSAGLVRVFIWDTVESRWRHFNRGNPNILSAAPVSTSLDLRSADVNLSRFLGLDENSAHVKFAIVPTRTMPTGDYELLFDYAELRIETDMRVFGGWARIPSAGTYYLCYETGQVIGASEQKPTSAAYRQAPGISATASSGTVTITNVNVAYATVTASTACNLHWMSFGW